jgi:hypothetical protein
MTLYETNHHYDDDDDGDVSQTFMKIKYVVSYDNIALVFISSLLSKLAQAVKIVTCIGCSFLYLTDKRRPDALLSCY